MRELGILNTSADPDVFRHSPKLICCVCRLFWKLTVTENQASAFVYSKRAVFTEYRIIFRHSETVLSCLKRIFAIVRKYAVIIRLNQRTVIKTNFVNRADMLPHERIFKPSAVVNQHHGERTAEYSCPANSRREYAIPIKIIVFLLTKIFNFSVRNTVKLESAPDGFLCRCVNDSCKKPVFLVEHREKFIRHGRLRFKTVLLAGIIRCAVTVQNVCESVQTLRFFAYLVHSSTSVSGGSWQLSALSKLGI